jgi:hypothetical protein
MGIYIILRTAILALHSIPSRFSPVTVEQVAALAENVLRCSVEALDSLVSVSA